MSKDIQTPSGSQEVAPITVDTKGACKVTGLSRQRLHKIRNDAAMNFPEPIKVGRSVRWFVSDLMAWLQSMKPSNSQQSAISADKTVALKASSTNRQGMPEKPRSRFLLNTTKAKVAPTVAELAVANRKAQATRRRPGQYLLRRMIDTRDGARDWQYYEFPLVPGKGFVPAKVGPRKIFVPMVLPDAERQRLLARATAMRTASLASLPMIATPKSDTNAQKTEASLIEMKAAYEVEGKSLDDLCKRYRMGKGRVLKLLRAAGTEMRPSGRKSKPINS